MGIYISMGNIFEYNGYYNYNFYFNKSIYLKEIVGKNSIGLKFYSRLYPTCYIKFYNYADYYFTNKLNKVKLFDCDSCLIYGTSKIHIEQLANILKTDIYNNYICNLPTI